jgi:hypothetical protein
LTAFSLVGNSLSMFMFEVRNIVKWRIVNMYSPFSSLNFDTLVHVYYEAEGSMFLWVTCTIYQIMWSNKPEGHNPKENILL